MSLITLSAADRHRRVSADFSALVKGTRDWSAPSPVAEWDAAGVLGHLIGWLPGMLLLGCELELPQGPDPAADPVAAWEMRSTAVQDILDDPEKATVTYRSGMLGDMTVTELLDRFWTADVFMHSWDLARATGQDIAIDASMSQALLSGLSSMEEVIRASKQFGEARPVAEDASVQDRLIAFIGRDPGWSAAVHGDHAGRSGGSG